MLSGQNEKIFDSLDDDYIRIADEELDLELDGELVSADVPEDTSCQQVGQFVQGYITGPAADWSMGFSLAKSGSALGMPVPGGPLVLFALTGASAYMNPYLIGPAIEMVMKDWSKKPVGIKQALVGTAVAGGTGLALYYLAGPALLEMGSGAVVSGVGFVAGKAVPFVIEKATPVAVTTLEELPSVVKKLCGFWNKGVGSPGEFKEGLLDKDWVVVGEKEAVVTPAKTV